MRGQSTAAVAEKQAPVQGQLGSPTLDAPKQVVTEHQQRDATMAFPAPLPTGPNVYQCIADAQARIAKVGIGKDRTAQTGGQGSYKFRGIDDVYNLLASILADVGLVIVPRMLTRNVVERMSGNNKALFYVTVEAEFDFVSAHDRSKHTARTFGEAMDSGDKATNKAMSAAYKYAAFQTFCIPTEAQDSETETHDVKAAAPDGFDKWWSGMELVAAKGTAELLKEWRDREKCPTAYCNFLLDTRKAEWEALKARAAKVTEAEG